MPSTLVVLSLVGLTFAQSMAFDVASIKASPPPPPNPFGFPTRSVVRIDRAGRVSASQVTLRELIRRAYDLPDFQIDGGPAWMALDRFELIAKPRTDIGATIGADAVRAMLRSMLAERFRLKAHPETRELAIYRLVPVRRDGKNVAQLRPSAVDCPAVRATHGAETPPEDGSKLECGITYQMSQGVMTMELKGESLNELMRALVTETRRPVVDDTGLRGTFDGSVTFVPQPLPGFPPAPGPPADGVSVFTALQEQLGLKLEPGRGPATVLVIDSADRPTEN